MKLLVFSLILTYSVVNGEPDLEPDDDLFQLIGHHGECQVYAKKKLEMQFFLQTVPYELTIKKYLCREVFRKIG